MKNTRRMDRMARNRRSIPKLNLTSLMDVFTILVFFLLVNSATTEVLTQPKQITLPDSDVESKPRETVVIFIGTEEVVVQGVAVARVADIAATEGEYLEPISKRLAELAGGLIGLNTQTVAESQEVTVLADKEVPFNVIKKVMATCTEEGYTKVSLAVMQKAAQVAS
ncbi:MAG: ExbD/TolR family protein [Steroidobacteraceae bacterium]|jgi:biopolymer transport protein ExbD